MKTRSIIISVGILFLVLSAFTGVRKRDDLVNGFGKQVFSPGFLSWSGKSGGLVILEISAKRIDILEKSGSLIRGNTFVGIPTGLFVGEDKILVTTDKNQGTLHVINPEGLKDIFQFNIGPGSRSPVIIPSKNLVSVCQTWSDNIGVYSLSDGKMVREIPVLKQPFTSVLSKDEKFLFVSNFTTHQRADRDTVASAISVINTETWNLEKNILLANGSNALRGMSLSSDGAYVLISHNLGRFQVPTTQLEQGWMNTSALSIVKVSDQSYQGTILLDEPEYGAAGSWGVDCDNGFIAVAHSGTHDFSLIREEEFFAKLSGTANREVLAYDLNFLSGIRERIKLPGNGPRSLCMNNKSVYIGMYFSDTVNYYDISDESGAVKSFALNDGFEESLERKGEKYFNDASFCFQGWQSCNGCHPFDARTDGLNWDLLNDGVGNPRNCKSMLLAHNTPPAMITGIRPDAETAVRAGFRYIQFAQVPEDHTRAVDAYLKSLQAVPSPKLINGRLSERAERGRLLFENLSCDLCHSGPYYTDMKMHTFTSRNDTLGPQSWDTPTLVEVWRTGPWMHDGRCAEMEDVFRVERHGISEELSDAELKELAEYVLSL